MSKVTGLSWGAIRGYYAPVVNGIEGSWQKLPNIVEGTLTINTEKGDKRTAPIEGGGNEFIAYKKSTFSVEWEHRDALEDGGLRNKPVQDIDGLTEGVYALKFIPETEGVRGIYIKRAVLTVEDSYSSEDGIKWKYTADVLAPENIKEPSIHYQVLQDPGEFTVTYNANGASTGSAPTDSKLYGFNEEVTVLGNTATPTAMSETGKTFDGWNTKADGTGTHYDAGDKFQITENVTLYAQWVATA